MVRCSNNNPFVTCISCTLLLPSVRTLLNVTCQDIIKFFSVASEIGEVGPSFMVCFKEQPYSLPSPAHVEIMFFHFVKWMKIKRILKRMNCVQVGTTLEVKMEKTKRLQWKEGNENLVSKKKEKAVYQWYWKWKKLLLPRLHTILALGSVWAQGESWWRICLAWSYERAFWEAFVGACFDWLPCSSWP